MSGGRADLFRHLAIAAAVWAANPVAVAQGSVDLKQVKIERMLLSEALQLLAVTYDASLIVSSETVNGQVSTPLNGTFSLQAALDELLSETNLVGHLTTGGAIFVSPHIDKNSELDPEDPLVVDKNLKKKLLASAVAITVATAPAAAQEAAEAAPAVEETRRLKAVTVTAAKREQSLQDVSTAISAVSPELLADSQINTLEDLQVAVPGLTIGNDFAFAKIFVRGIGLNSSFPGSDPSVALHVDGAVISQASQQFGSLFDLERVEVLRGPQGTLYGRNATGGSVNLITAKPTDEWEAYTNFTIGGPELNIIAEGAVSGPLTDNVQGRIAFRHQNREGFGIHTGTGEDVDDANKLGIRGQLNFDLSDRVSNLIMVERYEEDEASKAVKFIEATFSDAQIEALRPEFGDAVNGLQSLAAAGGAVPLARDFGGDSVPIGDLETTNITNTFTFDVNDLLTFKSITNYREGESTLLQDFDISDQVTGGFFTGAPTTSTNQYQFVGNEQLSQELQLSFDSDRWRGLVGGYYFEDEIRSTILIGADPLRNIGTVDIFAATADADPSQNLVANNRVVIPSEMDVEALALFANFTFDVTDALSVKLGARYSEEDRAIRNRFGVQGGPVPFAFDPVRSVERDYSDFTPEIGFEYMLDNTLLYATYSEGFKSGTGALGQRFPSLVNPETIENIELGLKGSYFDDSLRLSLAGFHYTVEDAQFDRTSAIPVPPGFAVSIENAATTEGQGLELEGNWQATDNFRLDFNGTLYDIAFEEFITQDPLDPNLFVNFAAVFADPAAFSTDLAGNAPRNTPDYSFGLRGTYTQDLANGGTVDYSAAYAYKGEQFFTEFNTDRLAADAYGILDANIKYSLPNDNFTVNLWGKNLTDEEVVSGAFAISTSRSITGTLLPPRSYGVTLGYRF